MTKQEWEQKWWEEFLKFRRSSPTAPLLKVHAATTKFMQQKYGPCPKDNSTLKGPGVIGLIKGGLLVRKIASMPFKFDLKTFAAAVAAGASAFGGAYGLAILEQSAGGTAVVSAEWFNIAWVVLSAAAAAFYNSAPKPPVV